MFFKRFKLGVPNQDSARHMRPSRSIIVALQSLPHKDNVLHLTRQSYFKFARILTVIFLFFFYRNMFSENKERKIEAENHIFNEVRTG